MSAWVARARELGCHGKLPACKTCPGQKTCFIIPRLPTRPRARSHPSKGQTLQIPPETTWQSVSIPSQGGQQGDNGARSPRMISSFFSFSPDSWSKTSFLGSMALTLYALLVRASCCTGHQHLAPILNPRAAPNCLPGPKRLPGCPSVIFALIFAT